MQQPIQINRTLQELNDEKAKLLIPVIVYISILMITGFIGNSMVCVYYGCKTRRTSTTLFISLLAIFDLTACVIAMPGEIIDIRYFFMFENVVMCKLSKFVNHLTAVGSSLTLVIVAFDRHRRICFPLHEQIQVKQAIIACVATGLVALFFAWPSLIFYGPTAVDIPLQNSINITLTGNDCTTTKEEVYASIILIFNGIYLLIFLFLSISVTVLYYRMSRVVLLHSRRRAVNSTITATTSQSSADDTALTDVSNDIELHKIARTHDDKPSIKGGLTPVSVESMPKEHAGKRVYKVVEKQRTLDAKTIKCTIIMFTVTIVFIISCLPYLALVIWKTLDGGYENDLLSGAGLIAFEIGMRSYLLNNAVNPIMYGFFNAKFRRFVWSSFCPCLHK